VNHKAPSGAWEKEFFLSPRGLRTKVALEVIGFRADGPGFPVTIADISRDGCQIQSDVSFDVGETIKLKHEVMGELLGEVRWASAGRAGLQFLRQL
jgi:hypothetical protein